MKAKVSGVPYEVELPLEDIVSTLEHENRCMRARMDRLESELALVNELVSRLNIENINLKQKITIYEKPLHTEV